MTDLVHIEFRFFLIGCKKVGKNSIIQRFKTLNSTSTVLNDDNTFKKIYTISKYNFTMRFFKINNSEKSKKNKSDANRDEDDNDPNKSHSFNFANVVGQLNTLTSLESDIKDVKNVFLFIYDLSNYDTLDKLQHYYDELYSKFEIDKYYKALIGNKVDKKLVYKNASENDRVKDKVNNFFAEKMSEDQELDLKKLIFSQKKSYEISTKIFFNFERFFENIFFDLFSKTNEEFQTDYFKERFRNIMIFKPTFSRSERTYFKSNNVPGPQKYHSNVYDLESDNEKGNIFVGESKYKHKIFVNKIGPVFPVSKKGEKNIKKLREKDEKRELKSETKTEPMPPEYFQKIFNNFSGFTFGMKTHKKINLREKRKADFLREANSFELILNPPEFENITNTQFYATNKKLTKRSKTLNEKPKKRERKAKKYNVKTKEQIMKQHEAEILSKIKAKEYVKPIREQKEYKTFYDESKKKPADLYPGPGKYDIPGLITTDRGFSFGRKTNPKEFMTKTSPSYYLLHGDFLINTHSSFPKAERFQKSGIQISAKEGNNQDENETKINYKEIENRKRKEEFEILRRKIEAEKERDAILEQERKKRELRLNERNRVPGPGEHDLDYRQVEETLPKYTLGARLDKGFMNQNDDPNKNYNLEQSFSMLNKNVSKAIYPLPNYNVGKPAVPGFKYAKGNSRFPPLPNHENLPPIHDEISEKTQVEINNDKNKVFYLGKSQRFKELSNPAFIGGQLYKLKGFAEELVQKNEKALELKRKHKLNALENEKRMKEEEEERNNDLNNSEQEESMEEN